MDRSAPALRVAVLGPLVLQVDGREVEVPGARRRALLAVLALAGGRPVSPTRLVDVVWPDDPPENAAASLQNHVSRLRGHLTPYGDRLTREPAGYRLRLEEDELDVRLAEQHARSDPGAALACWRGPALAEFDGVPDLDADAVRLTEWRLGLVEADLEQRLADGDPTVTLDAAAALAVSPYRERAALLSVRALAADGRVAEAMAVAHEFRTRLVEDTGLDPTPALADLEQRVASGTSGAGARARLPRPEGPMVGRRQEREEVQRLLDRQAVVTLTGPGGVGKTRLAYDVAAELSADQDVIAVPLAVVENPGRAPEAVAAALGLRLTQADAASIAGALAGRSLLLLLDNCEHVLDACRDLVTALRGRAPGVRVLATSRVTLDVGEEYVLRLQPLAPPRTDADLGALRRQSSVRAFAAHVRRREPDYEVSAAEADDLIEVLRRLDGLPLGIELAARQRAVMPMAAVRERLDRALDLGTGRDGPEEDRRRTLRATIDSSYRLLGPDEQALLCAVAPFVGGVDLDTVEHLAADSDADPVDLLHRLIDSSLLVADAARGRYRLLFTVRAFLVDLLVADGAQHAAQQRFVERCVVVAEQLRVAVRTDAEAAADVRLRAELDNLRSARDVGDVDARLRITVAVNDATTWRDLRETWSWALEIAEDPALAAHPSRVAVLAGAAEAARLLGDLDAAARWADQAIALAGPDLGLPALARAQSVLAVVAHYRGDFARARDLWLLAAEAGSDDSCSFVGSAALAASYDGDTGSARDLLARAATLERCGSHTAFLAYVRGELALNTDPGAAAGHYLDAINLASTLGCTFVEGVARVSRTVAQLRAGDVRGAADGLGRLLDRWRSTGQETQLWTTARNAARLLADADRPRIATLVLLRADLAPGAAAVDERIARNSGRAYTPVHSLVRPEELDGLRSEAELRGDADILDEARAELAELARGPLDPAR